MKWIRPDGTEKATTVVPTAAHLDHAASSGGDLYFTLDDGSVHRIGTTDGSTLTLTGECGPFGGLWEGRLLPIPRAGRAFTTVCGTGPHPEPFTPGIRVRHYDASGDRTGETTEVMTATSGGVSDPTSGAVDSTGRIWIGGSGCSAGGGRLDCTTSGVGAQAAVVGYTTSGPVAGLGLLTEGAAVEGMRSAGGGTVSLAVPRQGFEGGWDVSLLTAPLTAPGPVVPGAPGAPGVSGGDRQVRVSWSAPVSDGGSPVTGYRITPHRNGVAQAPITVGNVTSRVVTGLDNGVSYRFTVAAINAVGRGPESSSSANVVPAAVASPGAVAKRLSQEVLGRDPTAVEQAAWAGQLESGAKTPGALVADLRARSESTAKVDPAARLYTAYFLRRPDASGLRYWIAQLRAGRSNRWVAEFFARSPEFQQRYGTLSNREFVELIYRNILGRPGEASGVEFWTGRLDSGTNTRGWVMVGFSESAEYKRDQASEVEVAVLYTLLLGRAPTLAEYTADVALLDGGTTVAALADRIITSPEYPAR